MMRPRRPLRTIDCGQMTSRTLFRTLFGSSVLLMSLCLSSLPQALAHTQSLTVEHQVTTSTEFLAVVAPSTEITSLLSVGESFAEPRAQHSAQKKLLSTQVDAFELGDGRRVLVVAADVWAQSGLNFSGELKVTRFRLEPGQFLAFVETSQTLALQPLVAGKGMLKGLFVMSRDQVHRLSKNPMNYVRVLSVAPSAVPNLFVSPRDEEPSAESLNEVEELQSFLRSQEWISMRAAAAPEGRISPIALDRMLKDVRVLSGEESFADPSQSGKVVRIAERGSEQGRELTRQYLVNEFKLAGAEAKTWCYRSGRSSGCNVIAVLAHPGAKETLVLSSHLDSVKNAGADDNASGTAALLELARVFRNKPLTINVAFVAFDQEELGLVGSAAMAKEIGASIPGTFLANINTDMIGYDSNDDGVIHAMDCDRDDSQWLVSAASAAMKSWSLPLTIKKACTNRSDHASFWKIGKSATIFSENFFGGDENRCYHRSCDKIDLINQKYYQNIVTLMYASTLLVSEGVRQFRADGNVTSLAP